MTADQLEALLAPLGDPPCGDNLDGTPEFLELDKASQGKPDQELGGFKVAAQPPDWERVHKLALALGQRTRDLRVAVLLTLSGAGVVGFEGLASGLQLVQQLLERYWPQVYPLLDATERDDPTERINALQPLFDFTGLATLRAIRLVPSRNSLTLRQIELAIGGAKPLDDETLPATEAVIGEVKEQLGKDPRLAERMTGAVAAARGIAAALEGRLGAARAPDLAPLIALLQPIADAVVAAAGSGEDVAAGDREGVGAQAAASSRRPETVAVGSIASREDALRALDRVCEWIERNEPTNPAPLLIRRAKRLMTKDFLDIIRDLLPDGIGEVEKLAGLSNP